MTYANIRPLNEELKNIAKNELREVENRIADDIANLRTWIKKQPHLKARTDDQFLVAFLRGCKYSLEKAKTKVDYFYTIRTMLPELFAHIKMDEKMINFSRTGSCLRLPKPLGEGGPRIQFCICSKFDPKLYNIIDILRYQSLIMDWHIHDDDNSVISGYIQLIDASNINYAILKQIDPILIKKLSILADKAVPMRFKGLHFVRCPKEAQTILSLTRSLMSSKMQKRFYVHKSLEDLYKVIPKEYLPLEYGGTNGNIADIIKQTEKELLAFNDYFIENEQYVVDEKLRSGKQLDMNTIFGLEGSFRKLEID